MHVLQLGTSVQFCVEVYCSSTCLVLEEVYSFVHMCTAEACGMVQLTSVQFCAVVYCSVHACASVRKKCTVLCVCVLPKRCVLQLTSIQLCAGVYCSAHACLFQTVEFCADVYCRSQWCGAAYKCTVLCGCVLLSSCMCFSLEQLYTGSDISNAWRTVSWGRSVKKVLIIDTAELTCLMYPFLEVSSSLQPLPTNYSKTIDIKIIIGRTKTYLHIFHETDWWKIKFWWMKI